MNAVEGSRAAAVNAATSLPSTPSMLSTPSAPPPEMTRVPVILLGLGGVGRALVRQIVAARGVHARRFGLALDVAAVADSTAAVLPVPPRTALADDDLPAFTIAKDRGRSLWGMTTSPSLPRHLAWNDDPYAWRALDVPHAIVVDCTASAATTPHLRAALERGWDIVLANKLPLAGEPDDFSFLTGDGVDAGEVAVPGRRGRARWEATVGAGVPLIATLARLVAADDALVRIEGTFSGTLNFVATELRAGRPLSAIVAAARARGFTEPDPRTDLGGHDMARKALILARMLGGRLEIGDVRVEGLYPAAWDDPASADHVADIDAFLRRLPSLDAPTAARVAAAEAAGGVYRVVAAVTSGAGDVGEAGDAGGESSGPSDASASIASVTPTVVPADSPMGRLTGTDNLVAFHTRWYDAAPLVLQGRGAGVEATAA
ncbi:MAG: hypothetical protein ABI780_14665, partial [Ardenticatenales bacterium]